MQFYKKDSNRDLNNKCLIYIIGRFKYNNNAYFIGS